jgi:hypothetical protein
MKKFYIILLLTLSLNLSSIQAALIATPKQLRLAERPNSDVTSNYRLNDLTYQQEPKKSEHSRRGVSITQKIAAKQITGSPLTSKTNDDKKRILSTLSPILDFAGFLSMIILFGVKMLIFGLVLAIILGSIGFILGITALRKEGKNTLAVLGVIMGIPPAFLLLLTILALIFM